MNALSQFLNNSKQNKLFTAVVILLCLGVIEFTTHFFSEFPRKLSGEAQGQVVAVVQTVQTDVRQKPVEEPSWYRAEPQAEVMRGDAIYSGRQSHSQVKMGSGGIIELGEETLVIFDDIDGVTIPDVTRGQVKLKITGNMKIAISGEVTEFTGAQSELVLNADGTRSVRVTKGQASVGRKGLSIRSLTTGEVLELPAAKSEPAKIQAPKVDEVAAAPISEKRKLSETPVQPEKFEPVKPVVKATPVPQPVVVAPTPAPVLDPVIEVKPEPPPPPPPVVKQALKAQDPALKIDRIMKVQEVYRRQGQRALVPRTGLKFLKVPVALAWSGTNPEEKVVVQVSKDSQFKKPWAEREASGPNVVISEWKSGRNYWRVSRDRKSWSAPAEVVVKPTVSPVQRPSVAVLNRNVVVYPKGRGPQAQAKLRFQDSGLAKPRGWVLQGSNSAAFSPSKTRTMYLSEPHAEVPLAKPGKYFFRIRSVAAAGELSTFSGPVEVKATKAVAPPVQLAPRLAKKEKKPEREVAAIEEEKIEEEKFEEPVKQEPVQRQTTKMKSNVETRDNRERPWSVVLEGGETALVGSEQIANETDFASMHQAGIQVGYKVPKYSASLAYRGQFGAANAEGSAQSSSRLSLRYSRWWNTKWSFLRLGWKSGFDSYRNTSSTGFSKGHDTARTGVDVAIRAGERWNMGGEILGGMWFDSNRIFQFGGFLTYDLRQDLVLGVGYRLSLFDAGVDSSAVNSILPYREATGEAFSSLQFNF